MRTLLGLLLAATLTAVTGGQPARQSVNAFTIPRSGTLILAEAPGEVMAAPRSAILRYTVANRPPGVLSTNPYEAGIKVGVTPAQIEDAVARLEAAGVDSGAITVERYRPFNGLGAPLGTVAVLTVKLARPTLDTIDRLYAVNLGLNSQYLGTWSAVDRCEFARTAASRAAQRTAAAIAGAAASAFDATLGALVHQTEYPLSDTSAGYQIASSADLPTYCAGAPPPPVQNIDSSPGAFGSAARAVFATLVLSAYRARGPALQRGDRAAAPQHDDRAAASERSDRAAASQRGVAVNGVTLVPAGGLGETNLDPLLGSFHATAAARYYSVEVTRFVRIDRPAAWLVSLTPNGATTEAVRSILADMGVPTAEVLERVNPRGAREVVVKLSVDRTGLARFLSDFDARALRGNVPVFSRASAVAQNCPDAMQAATAAAASAARDSARSFARATGLRLGRIAAIAARVQPERLACDVGSPDVHTLAEIPDAAAAYPGDTPLEATGRVRATVHVYYALR